MTIEAVDLRFKYDKQEIIKGCSFCLEKGKLYCILGRNGSGKSTLIKLISGLLLPNKGQIRINGRDLKKHSKKDLARIMASVSQEQNNVFSYRVLDMVVMGRTPYLRLFSSPSAKDYELAIEALQQIGMQELKDHFFMELSGGEQQMVLLARAIAQQASYFILDEPTSHLDFYNQQAIMKCLCGIIKKQECSAVIAMHDPNLALNFADEVIMIKSGQLLAQGPVQQVMTSDNLRSLYNMDIKVVSLKEEKRVFVC